MLTWNPDGWIEMKRDQWVAVEQSSKIIFSVATAIPSLFLLLVIDLELFGILPLRWKRKVKINGLDAIMVILNLKLKFNFYDLTIMTQV